MFDRMKGMMGQMQMMQALMKDENFKAFISHPRVQELFRDPEFKEVAGARDFGRIAAHPRFVEVTRDPEVAALLVKINPQNFKSF